MKKKYGSPLTSTPHIQLFFLLFTSFCPKDTLNSAPDILPKHNTLPVYSEVLSLSIFPFIETFTLVDKCECIGTNYLRGKRDGR